MHQDCRFLLVMMFIFVSFSIRHGQTLIMNQPTTPSSNIQASPAGRVAAPVASSDHVSLDINGQHGVLNTFAYACLWIPIVMCGHYRDHWAFWESWIYSSVLEFQSRLTISSIPMIGVVLVGRGRFLAACCPRFA